MIGAGLMIRSLAALGRIDLGFNPNQVLTLRVAVPQQRYDTPEKTVEFYRQLNERVRALPGVQSAGFVRVLPLATTIGDFGLDVDGFEESPGRNAKGDWQIVDRRRVRGDGLAPDSRTLVHAGRHHELATGRGHQRNDGADLLEESGRGGRRPHSSRQPRPIPGRRSSAWSPTNGTTA